MRYHKIISLVAAFLLICTGFCHADSPDHLVLFDFPMPERQYPECAFENLNLPDHFVVYAAGGYTGGHKGRKPSSCRIDAKGTRAMQIDVVVNSPEQPVVLMLGEYWPTIWNISWSSDTNILAVLVASYAEQYVAGLSEEIPLLNSSGDNKEKCPHFSVPLSMENLNPLAKDLFGREVELAFLAEDGKVVVGKPLADDARLITSPRICPESFCKYKESAVVVETDLQDAVKKGILRPATIEDVRAWKAAMAQKEEEKPKPPKSPPTAGENPSAKARKNEHSIMMYNTYVVLQPFSIPPGLHGGYSANFLVLKGVPMPTGDPGDSNIYDFNTMTSTGPDTGHPYRKGR